MICLNRRAAVIFMALVVTVFLPFALWADTETQSSIEQAFQKARQDYLHKNMDSASRQIKKAADYMKAESVKASAKGKEAMTLSAAELEQLAADVKKGTVKSVRKIEQPFARAYLALANDAHIKSADSWTRKESAKAGDALESSAKYLERGLAWTGRKVETGTQKTIEKTKSISSRMKEKGGAIAGEIEKGLRDTGNEIRKLGKKISSPKGRKDSVDF